MGHCCNQTITLKCMVRRRTARGLKLGEGTVCVNVSGLLWRIALRALDDDPHVPVLLNPSVTRDAFECPCFPARRWTVLSSPSLLSRPWWNFQQSSSSWRWESGKRSVLSKRSVFSTAINRPPTAAADLILLAAGNAQAMRQLVRDATTTLLRGAREPADDPCPILLCRT